MKKILFFLFLIPFTCNAAYNWWPEQDMPLTGLPPIPTQIYTPPLNPLRRTIDEVSCCRQPNGTSCGISRKDIIKHTRSSRSITLSRKEIIKCSRAARLAQNAQSAATPAA